MSTQYEQQELDRMRNDPGNYKWGIFYFNPQDSRILVPRRIHWMGWTLNFASPYSYLIILGIIVFAVITGNLGK
jgi:uncharacterized membrane protein